MLTFMYAFKLIRETDPILRTSSHNMIKVLSITNQVATVRFIQSQDRLKEFNPRTMGKGATISGKGLPVANIQPNNSLLSCSISSNLLLWENNYFPSL